MKPLTTNWYKVTLTDDDISLGKHIALQDAFEQVYVFAGGPKKAVFFCHKQIAVHDYYFSPTAATIAGSVVANFKGVPCDPPNRSEVRPLVSHAGESDAAWD